MNSLTQYQQVLAWYAALDADQDQPGKTTARDRRLESIEMGNATEEYSHRAAWYTEAYLAAFRAKGSGVTGVNWLTTIAEDALASLLATEAGAEIQAKSVNQGSHDERSGGNGGTEGRESKHDLDH